MFLKHFFVFFYQVVPEIVADVHLLDLAVLVFGLNKAVLEEVVVVLLDYNDGRKTKVEIPQGIHVSLWVRAKQKLLPNVGKG